MLGLIIALLSVSAAAAAMTKLYLGKRDDLAASRLALDTTRETLNETIRKWEKQLRAAQEAEQARIQLARQVADLSNREAEVVHEIKTVWRDRTVYVESPQAVECASTAMPARVVSLLCDAAGSSSGACAMRAAAGGSPD